MGNNSCIWGDFETRNPQWKATISELWNNYLADQLGKKTSSNIINIKQLEKLMIITIQKKIKRNLIQEY